MDKLKSKIQSLCLSDLRYMDAEKRERLKQAVLINLEKIIADLKSKFVSPEAYNQFLEMIKEKNKKPPEE